MDFDAIISKLGGMKAAIGLELCPMTEDEVVEVEHDIGGKFPDAYRAFLKTYGACVLKGESIDNPYIVFRPLEKIPSHISSDGKGLIEVFYGGMVSGRDSFSLKARAKFYSGRIYPKLFPIGDDGGVGQLCIGISGEFAGKIYYWDRQNEALSEEEYFKDYGEPRPEDALLQNTYLVAADFLDFLNRLEFRKN